MKNLRKILCCVLSVLMLSGMLLTAPATANAAETNIQEVGATYSGTTGSCTWNLNTTTGVLTISGTGAMGNYSWSSDVPWDSYTSYVKTVSIANGVTSIGNKAFYYCTSLTSVTIPSSVTSIGSYAFYNCKSLTNVTIPSSVTSIGSDAFEDCTSLASVTIPSSVTSIGSDAFYKCTSLTSVTIPSSVTSIGSDAFYNCTSLTSINVNGSNTKYSSINGNLYNKDQTTLIQYAIGKTATSFTIPSSVTSIGSDAFYNCTSLTGVTIPSSVKSIGISAFRYCTSLTSVTIPSSVTSIGSYAFNSCTSLTSISVNSNNTKYSSINGNLYNKDQTTLIQYAIGKTATSFTIPSSVTSIGSDAFYYCTSLTSVTIPSSVTSIGSYAFYNCKSLTNVTIPSSVTSIGSDAFYKCTSLTGVTIPSSVTSIGSYAFYKCTSLTSITIPSSVTNIGYDAFNSCTSLTSVTIPSSVTSIGSDVFYNCTSLTSVTIPSSVTSIGNYAFYNCSKLKTVYYTGTASEWSNISIGTNNTPLTNATIYYSVEETEASETESTESSYETISLNVSKTVNISTAGDVKYYQFTPSKSGTYEIYSSGDYDTYGYLYDSNMSELTYNDDGGSGNNFKISYSLTAGRKYIIGAKFYRSSNTGSFTVTVTDGTGPITTEPTATTEATESTESSYETISLNVSKTVNISTAGDVKYYQFTPSKSGTYEIYSSGDYDTYGYLYNSNMSQLTYNDDDGSGSNFKISYSLTAGRKYIIGAKFYSSSNTGSFTVTVTDGTGPITTEPTEPTYLETESSEPTAESTESTESSYETISLNVSKTVNISTAGDVKYYQFIPSKSGTYEIYSSGSCDTCGYLYDSNMSQLAYNDDGESDSNFKISYSLTAGRKYIIGAKFWSSSRTGSFTVTVTDGTGPITTEPTEASSETEPVPTESTEAPTLPAEGTFHVVAGDPELCNGVNWDPASPLNLMTLGEDEVYSITYTNVPAGTYNFKVTTNGDWDNADYNLVGYANFGGADAEITVTEDNSTVVISLKESDMHANAYINDVLVEAPDLIKPTAYISSTNNVESSQTVTLTLSDNVGIAGYYWGTSSSYSSNTFSSTSSASITKTISSPGTYYLTAKDTSGNVSTTQSITFYKTTLNANGGTASQTTVLTKSGNSFTPSTPTKTGFAFAGWNKSSTATTGSTSITPTTNATYYAVWTRETISLNVSKTVNISTAGDVKYYQFTPSKSGTYEIYTSGEYDTYGYLYDSNMNELTYDDDGGSDSNFEISYNLTAGRKYIICTALYDSSYTGSFKLTVTKKPETVVCRHNSTWIRDKKSATYFERGYTGDKICNSCGKVVSKGRSVAKKILATPKAKIKSRGNSIVISYTKVKGAQGFEMECKFGSKKYSQKFKTSKSKTIKLSNIKRGIKATVKIRAFTTSGEKKAYSNWTKAKTLQIK